MTKILMVCLGNICRSPLAEGILKSKLPKNIFYIDSAGTANYHIGEQPDRRSIAIAKKYGIDISAQEGRQLVVSDFDAFDYIYAMDSENFNNIVNLARNSEDVSKVKLILEELNDSSITNVPDPYYGGEQGFENVYELLNEACEIIANKLDY
ncbi:low molecular weight phosphotyrosine protein phosphatase [Flavobacteriaceae bacterium AH-315-B10]|nr:low molecular weight phosphotyrosine protein phosphatase [Flavobacteriaceae bacterium AH-315-B10]